MKKCPYCYEDIQDAANVCKHCGRDQTTGEPADWLIPENQTSGLDVFEKFMLSYGKGWVLTNKTPTMMTYQKHIPAQQGSCLVALFLLLLFVLPAILYMIYGRSPAKTYQLTVALDPNGSLIPSGDSQGMGVYSKFLSSLRVAQKVG